MVVENRKKESEKEKKEEGKIGAVEKRKEHRRKKFNKTQRNDGKGRVKGERERE